MNKKALIIFVRMPMLGKVKTRLAASVGDAAALAIYKQLLAHTRQLTIPLQADRFVFYADEIVANDDWSDGYHKRLQSAGDLGNRMRTAFQQLFHDGYHRICIIGSDSFELTSAIIQQAFALLNESEIVIGPAADGGYYLLGMKDSLKAVFNGVDWSTGLVMKQTMDRVLENSYSHVLLPVLRDVDTVEDVPAAILSEVMAEYKFST